MGTEIPGDDRGLEEQLGAVHAVFEVPGPDPETRLHDQRDRKPELSVPAHGPATRTLPQRASRTQSPLPRHPKSPEKPSQHHWKSQRLEGYTEHACLVLRRADN